MNTVIHNFKNLPFKFWLAIFGFVMLGLSILGLAQILNPPVDDIFYGHNILWMEESATGKYLMFMYREGEVSCCAERRDNVDRYAIYVASTETDDLRELSLPIPENISRISLSPDGKWVAYTTPRNSSKTYTLMLLEASGNEPKLLEETSSRIAHLWWSDESLFYTSEGKSFRISIEDGSKEAGIFTPTPLDIYSTHNGVFTSLTATWTAHYQCLVDGIYRCQKFELRLVDNTTQETIWVYDQGDLSKRWLTFSMYMLVILASLVGIVLAPLFIVPYGFTHKEPVLFVMGISMWYLFLCIALICGVSSY